MKRKKSALAVIILVLGAVIIMSVILGKTSSGKTKNNGVDTAAETLGEAVFQSSESEETALFNQWVNNTKNYKEDITVHHKEDFDVQVTECTGGSIGASALNKIISLFVKPSDEILLFSEGSAKTKAGKTVPLLLPSSGSCGLSPEGVSEIKKYRENGSSVIYIKLKSETAGLNEKPPVNSSCVGYLDTGSMNLGIGKITDVTVNYTGTEIKAKANDKGYIEQIEYTIPFEASGKAKIGLVQCGGKVTGVKKEIWVLKW